MLTTEEKKMANSIIKFVAEQYSATASEIFTGKRWFPDVEARYTCFFLLKKHAFSDYSSAEAYRKIARFFKLKNGNIIRYALRKINFSWLKYDQRFQQQLDFIDQKVNDNEDN